MNATDAAATAATAPTTFADLKRGKIVLSHLTPTTIADDKIIATARTIAAELSADDSYRTRCTAHLALLLTDYSILRAFRHMAATPAKISRWIDSQVMDCSNECSTFDHPRTAPAYCARYTD